MKQIDKKYFTENVKELLEDNVIPIISNDNINEFKLGKNYFYEIIDNSKLKKVQKWLNYYFQETIELNNAAVAFRKKLSYLHLFEPHRKKYHFLRLDIRSFFHSINIDDIKNSFNVYFEDDFIDEDGQESLVDTFIKLVTYTIPENSQNKKFRGKQVLPMGFITSPIISNVIFRKLDILIQGFCSERNIIYTRYADDMLFSSDRNMSYIHSDNFINEINILISQNNLKLNKNKTIRAKHTLSLNGYTIQYSKFEKDIFGISSREITINELRLSKKKIDIINQMIYILNKEKIKSSVVLKKLFNYKINSTKFKYPTTNSNTIEKYYDDQLLNKLAGYRSYLLSVITFNNKYKCCQENTTEKYLRLVDDLNKIIEKIN